MTLEQTIQYQQNRINELEQQLESQRESHIRFIEKLQSQLNTLQEQVECLLDPEEKWAELERRVNKESEYTQ